jgi:CO/xanthine dehydrogenase Mo-binding subunit
MTSLMEKELSRRDFLKGTGALVVAFSVPLTLRTSTAGGAVGPALIDARQVDSWLAIAQDGKVTILVGKVELGTGVMTATMQIAADELDVPMTAVELVQGDTWRTPDQGTTAGSQSIKTQWAAGLRQAAAEAKAALLTMASTRLGVPVSELAVADGVVSARSDASKKASYGELIGGQRFNLTISNKAKLKSPAELKVVGRSVRRVDVPHKVKSREEYVRT